MQNIDGYLTDIKEAIQEVNSYRKGYPRTFADDWYSNPNLVFRVHQYVCPEHYVHLTYIEDMHDVNEKYQKDLALNRQSRQALTNFFHASSQK